MPVGRKPSGGGGFLGPCLLASQALVWVTWPCAVQYTNLIPPVSVELLSYGRFMQLLKGKQIKRIQVLGDGTAAIVDVSPPFLLSSHLASSFIGFRWSRKRR